MSPSRASQTESGLWQFWIDVGGTFTDCQAVDPQGNSHEAKELSSGIVKSQLRDVLKIPTRWSVDPDAGNDFWVGAKFRILADNGKTEFESTVQQYDSASGEISLQELPSDSKVDRLLKLIEATESLRYELDLEIPAPILAIRRLLKLPLCSPIPTCRVHLGTTRGTNALLTRTGASTALVTTRGFGDLLEIGDQARPSLFELDIQKPKSLTEVCIEIDERILADGTVEQIPCEAAVRESLLELKSKGIASIAICLLHGYRYPKHEEIVGNIARSIGFSDVHLSSQVAPLIKMLSRAETTVLDAYLNPVLGNYLDHIENCLSSDSHLQLMTSAGGLVERKFFSGKDSVLSGPAGGIVGAVRAGEQIGFSRLLTFDMGGTSSDVGRYDGKIELEYETRKSDIRIMTPMVAIETVASGGGSICWFDGTTLRVGPQSASSNPGPACYGRGGPLTLTDVNLFLGRLVQSRFPFPLNETVVNNRLEELCRELESAGFQLTTLEAAYGLLTIANQNMASAIGSVSVSRGFDPSDYLLVAFGGAGPQHACDVANSIGVKKILDPPNGSILSAAGIRLADQKASRVRSVLEILKVEQLKRIKELWEEMEFEIQAELGMDAQFERSLDLRYVGTDACQSVALPKQSAALEGIVDLFNQIHQQRFGFISAREIEIVAARAEGKRTGLRLPKTTSIDHFASPKAGSEQNVAIRDPGTGCIDYQATPVFDRERLDSGDTVQGPALIAGALSTTMVEPGWEATMMTEGQLLMEQTGGKIGPAVDPSIHQMERVDPTQLEIFNNHFSTIARQMGIALQMTSMSVNVKERLDFSCAIFTAAGDLVVNAPHIPVHLGAMSETVRTTIRLNSSISEGDVFVTNDPYGGGSHLPDVTVITPVFDSGNRRLIFWVASRSHHAEIGGIAPGSMPPDATNLQQEGVLIRNFKLVDGPTGEAHFEALRQILTRPPYPSRAPEENLADLRAQVAANRSGLLDLLKLVDQYSVNHVLAYTVFMQDAAEQKMRQAIGRMKIGTYRFEDQLDNGATIRVAVTINQDSLKIDFDETDPVLEGNQNANPAIVSSAVIYVMRCFIRDNIPLNEGIVKPVEIVLPTCFLNPISYLNPEDCPAIVGGNVETSQRVVDVLLGALQQSVDGGFAAASQGTMNNWLMGDDSFGYYETVGGGAGATPSHHGANAVHTHMTNTRLTDPEILESRYPVILREFSVRRGSGGPGLHQGGDGIVREIEFLKPLTVSLLTNRRLKQPYGVEGGFPGKPGVNIRIGSEGRLEILPPSCELKVATGERLRLETPGGGGWREPKATRDGSS
jgi:5-oxoprolinase (ATP-hydrolysing)